MRRQLTGILVATALAAGGGIASASQAAAKDGDSRYRGSCSNASDYVAKVRDEGSTLRIEFWVKANRVGQVWKYTLTQNGNPIAASSRVSRATDDTSADDTRHIAEAKWRNTVTDAPGADTLVLRATHAGEVCKAAITQ